MTGTIDDTRYQGIRRYNLIAAALHALQAGLILALANDFTLPVTGTYLEGPPGTTPGETVTILDTPVGLAVAGEMFQGHNHMLVINGFSPSL